MDKSIATQGSNEVHVASSRPPAPLLVSRRSRFLENMLEDPSIEEEIQEAPQNDGDDHAQRLQQQQPQQIPVSRRRLTLGLRKWAKHSAPMRRMLNAGLHLVASSMLAAIMIEFLQRELSRSAYTWPIFRERAIALLTLSTLECLIDAHAIVHPTRKSHPGWLIFLRLLLSLGYIVHYLLLAQVGSLFPAQYSYWGLAANASDTMLYALVSIVLAWDLCHATMNRHAISEAITSLLARFRGEIQAGRGEVRRDNAIDDCPPQLPPLQPTTSTAHDPEAYKGFQGCPYDVGLVEISPRRPCDVEDFDLPMPPRRASYPRLQNWQLPLEAIPWAEENHSTSTLVNSGTRTPV